MACDTTAELDLLAVLEDRARTRSSRRSGRRCDIASSVRPAPISPAKPTISPRRTDEARALADEPVLRPAGARPSSRGPRRTPRRSPACGPGTGCSSSRPTIPLMIRSSSTPSASTSRVSMDLPSRMMVILSAICSISLSLWEIMIERDAAGLQPAHQVQQVLGVGLVQRGGGLVQDEQLHVLVQRLGDLHELLLADADVLDRGVRDPREARPGPSARWRRLRASSQSITPPLAGSLPRKMFSVMDSSGISASSWWMMTMPACSLARMSLNCWTSALVDDVAVVGAVRVDPGQHLHQGGLAGAVLAADGVDLAGLDPEADLRQRLDAGELLGDGAHLEDYWITLRGSGTSYALTPPMHDFVVRPRKPRGRLMKK